MSVQLQVLDACNLRCAHCYNADADMTRMPSGAELRRRLDAVFGFARRREFEPDIHLSGGEPTLRRDLVDLVRYIFEVHQGDALLFTNGTRWSLKLAGDLWRAGLRFVQVSLEGPQALNDAIRGGGVFDAATSTLRLLGEHGFRCTVSITVTAGNFPVLFSFVDQLDPLGVHFHLREVFPIGAGAELAGLTRTQRRRLFEWAVGWSGRSTLSLEDPAHCSVSPEYAASRRGCVAGRNHFCVDVDGSVYPCRPLALRVGSVDDLDAAWTSPTMTRIRQRDFEGSCGRCELKHHSGGCRVHAQLGGNLFGEDRRCFAAEAGLVRTPFEAGAIRAAESVGRGVHRVRGLYEHVRRRLPLVR
jgi:radical SAM protein with 4Fe4S-binding SPASM domain